MTAGQFREVDLDLLADYVGGALEGTRDEAIVERLIVEDPAWERAHAALIRAFDAVRADLAGWGAAPEPMPTDVADRLTAVLTTAALTTAPPVAAPPEQPEQPEQPQQPEKPEQRVGRPGGRPPAVPRQTRPGGAARNRGTTPARRRWSRLAGPMAVAAALVAFAGFGVSRLAETSRSGDTAAITADQAGSGGPPPAAPEIAEGGAPPHPLLEPTAAQLVASGTDYAPATLAAGAGALSERTTDRVRTQDAPDTKHGSTGGGATSPSLVGAPPGLARLTGRTALAGCLDAVTAEHARGPLAVEVVDYATFETDPALIVIFTDPRLARWAWASGPDCGLAGSGADTRSRAQVG